MTTVVAQVMEEAIHWPWVRSKAMTQAEIERELLALRSEFNVLTERTQVRETEWRRLGLIAKVTGVLASITGAGFMIANVVVERTGSNSNFHDQLVMMGIVFIFLSIPLLIMGQALHHAHLSGQK
jgi:hypothetical protein